jgi:SAM-dependent methyltransferase
MNKEVSNIIKWNKIYKEKLPNEIPWNFEEVPAWFTEVIKSGWVKPCKTLDVGCGLGNYSNYLAEHNFNVLGIDYSEEAINQNLKKYKNNNLKFKLHDATNLKLLIENNKSELFDFVIDVSYFHYVKPDLRSKYSDSLYLITKNNAKILITCFSDNDPIFNGDKEFINPDIEMITYVLSKEEIIESFEENFFIDEINEIEFGKQSKIGGSVGKTGSLTRKRHLVKLIRKN